MAEWKVIERDEQETYIHIDYDGETIKLYTSRKGVADRLQRKGLVPEQVELFEGKIVSMVFECPLNDKMSTWLLSKPTIIGGFANKKD